MRAVPRIIPGVAITPIASTEGLRYRLSPAQRGAGTIVPARTLPVLLLMDGTRTLEELHREITSLGVKMQDPAKMIEMARLFEAAGIIEVRHHFLSPGPIRHRCLRCGRSCEGHLVGPITDEEVQLLDSQLEELRANHPDIQEGPSTVEVKYEGGTHRVLNFPGGRCIFLSPDRLCRLHQRWGPQSKPLPCRMFPLRMIRTEEGTRVIQSPRCYLAHRTYREAAATTAEELLEEWGVWRPPALIQGLNPDNSESLLRTVTFLENLEEERALLALLDEGNLSLCSVMTALADRVVSPLAARPATLPGPAGSFEPLVPRLPDHQVQARFGVRVLEVIKNVLGSCFETDDSRPLSRFGSDLRTLVLSVAALEERTLPPWNDLPENTWQFVRFSLKNHLFSRGVMVFGSVRAGLLVFGMGVMAARWCCPSDTLERGPSDLFVQHQTTWIRVMSSPEVQAVLFPREDSCDELLAVLTGS